MPHSYFFKKILYRLHGKVVTLEPKNPSGKKVLFSHDITPFFRNNDDMLSAHANYWTVVEMARIFLEKNYTVDVIDLRNNTFVPKKKYTYFFDLGTNLERITPFLNSDCFKIHYIVGAHWLFQNTAEYQRCFDLQKRRGVAYFPNRLNTPTHNIENADFALVAGNTFVENTYAFANKKTKQITSPSGHVFPYFEEKNFDISRKNFIWFGGAGAVHKGLDLVLEAFAAMPEYHLTIFGKAWSDASFAKIYHQELFGTSNIQALPYLDLGSPEFEKIQKETVGIVYPSCSEGTAGSVTVSMQAGLIPIVSYESGVDMDDFGVVLPQNTVEEIRIAVTHIATLPAEELQKRSLLAYTKARAYFTRERFTNDFKSFIDQLESEKKL